MDTRYNLTQGTETTINESDEPVLHTSYNLTQDTEIMINELEAVAKNAKGKIEYILI